MTNSKTTKRALFSSVVALLLCFTMLLGTTFAWFTDSATSATNKIVAGNLDVELYHADKAQPTDDLVGSTTKLFDDVTLWEPGAIVWEKLTVKNNGSLDLKYILSVNVTDISTVNGKSLADVLKVAVLTEEPTRENVAAAATQSLATFNLESDKALKAGDSDVAYVAIYWAPSANDNDYNVASEALNATLGVTLLATQYTAETDSFDDQYDKDATYPVVDTMVTAANIAGIDFTEENTKFVFTGTFDAVSIPVLGDGSVIALANATIGDMTLGSDATVTGTGTLNNVETTRNSTEAVTLNITDATLDVTGNINVKNTDNKSVLNITNSEVTCGWIFVGEHTNNHPKALAEFNVINSVVSADEMTDVPETGASAGSTIAVWGQSGVSSKIYDSEIYTYSRGWYQSEDVNDNAITFQGANSINVDIQRSNMHLYGARSIINARKYANAEATVDFTIDESLIWVVTKSNHGENTLPVWGVDESNIKNSILLFTKNVHQDTPAVFKSFVYGNPVIHGDYHVTTQCQWDAAIALADGQTVTFAKDANVSIYEGAGNVEFVKNGSAKVVLEDGATVTNIDGLN